MKLDHVVITVNNLDEAIRNYRELGFTVVKGGVHANRATENALIIFSDGTYIELLAKTGEVSLPGLVDFSSLLDDNEGLKGFALLCDDLEAEIVRLRENGFDVSDAIPGERRRHDGTLIQWKLALINGGFSPFLIQDVTPREMRVSTNAALTTHANGASSVQTLDRNLLDGTWGGYMRYVDERMKRFENL